MDQRSISQETSLDGIGIHSGQKVHITFKPAGADTGIIFKRMDMSPAEIISIKDLKLSPQERRTAVTNGKAEVNTIEHLMAALFALEIDNIIVEVNAPEMPGLDGSGAEYFHALEKAGIKNLGKAKNTIVIKAPLWVEKGEAFIGIFPSSSYRASYILEVPTPSIKRQALTLELTSENVRKELIGARTFCMKEEAEMLLKMGFGKGANTANTLVMDANGPIDNTLRFPDEPVRHKLLDLVGDMYLLGAPIVGRIVAIRSGHNLNGELVTKIRNSNFEIRI